MSREEFGAYVAPEADCCEGLTLTFLPSQHSIQERWRNNGLSADFLADYFQAFIPREDGGGARRAQAKAAVGFIANELLENAMKYSAEDPERGSSLMLNLAEDKLLFHLTTQATPAATERLRAFLDEFTVMSPEDFCMKQMERMVESSDSSGMGFASMANDYGAELGWCIEQGDGALVTICSSVQLGI